MKHVLTTTGNCQGLMMLMQLQRHSENKTGIGTELTKGEMILQMGFQEREGERNVFKSVGKIM